MATRKTKTRAKARMSAADNQLAQAVTQSAQKIWLAGLGAFARARTEGDKLFDLLVEQGKTIRSKSEQGRRPGAEDRAHAGRRHALHRAGQVGQARAGVRGSRLALAQPPGRAHQQGRRRAGPPGLRPERERARPDGRRGAEARPQGPGEEGPREEGRRRRRRVARRNETSGEGHALPATGSSSSLSAPRRLPGTEGCSRPAGEPRGPFFTSRVTRSTSFT